MRLDGLASDAFSFDDKTGQYLSKYSTPGLLVFFLLFYVLLLGYRPLLIPDETRYAEIPREMLATGDWVVPHLDGLRYFEKPPLGYWLVEGSLDIFGENNFAVRFPGALAVGLTAFLVFILALKISGARQVAALASLIHLSFIEVYAVGVTSVLDNFVTLFLTAGIVSSYFAVDRSRQFQQSKLLWCISGVLFGLAFLTKGFLAFVVPAIVLIPWMLWEGQGKLMLTKGWLALFAAVITIMPWAILISHREGDFWRYFIWVEHVERFTTGEGQHKWPFYYFMMYLPGLAFPWFNLAPAAITALYRSRYERRGRGDLRLLCLWVIVPFIFFSASSGKLATYILPCFPPLSVLMAMGLFRSLRSNQSLPFNAGALLNALMLLALLTVLLISQYYDLGFRAFDATENTRVMIMTMALSLGVASAFFASLAKQPAAKLAAVVMTVIPLMLSVHFVVPNAARYEKMPGPLLEPFRSKITDDTVIIAEGSMIRSVNWYLKRDDVFLIQEKELAYGLDYPDASYRLLNADRFRKLLDETAGRRDVLLICKSSCEGKVDTLLPAAAEHQAYGNFNLWYLPE